MEIRRARLEDAQPIAGVHIRSWQVVYRGLIPDEILDGLDLAERSARWHRILLQTDQDVFVAEEGSTVRGFCSLGFVRDESEPRGIVGEITALYVEPEQWRTGLGRALCAAVVARAFDRGFRELVLWVLEANHGARAFYEAIGFCRDGAAGVARGFGGGVELPDVRYRMRLQSGG